MELFELDADALKKGWGAEEQYFFSVKDYKIVNHYDFADYDRPEDMSETQFLLSLGYIPYFNVKRIQLAKAYIAAVGSKKLQQKLANISDENYIEAFWKYFNAYPHLSEGYEEFQNNYLLKKAIDWCDENGINFKVI